MVKKRQNEWGLKQFNKAITTWCTIQAELQKIWLDLTIYSIQELQPSVRAKVY